MFSLPIVGDNSIIIIPLPPSNFFWIAAGNTILCEFYNHNLKDQFEELMSLLRQDEFRYKCKLLEYHNYDIVEIDGKSDLTFEQRINIRDKLFDNQLTATITPHLKLVETNVYQNKEELKAQYKEYIENGYEG